MNGIAYFGPGSIDVSSWVDQQKILDDIKSLREIIAHVNNSNLLAVEVPSDWSEFNADGPSFWEMLYRATENDPSIISLVSTSLYDGIFMSCTNNNIGLEIAKNRILTNNPDLEGKLYYAALSVSGEWLGVSSELHIKDDETLYKFVIKFLMEYPLSEGCFDSRCRHVFSNLIFHDNFVDTLSGHGTVSPNSNYSKARITGVNGFSYCIVKALEALNTVNLNEKDTKLILDEIGRNSGLECTAEGGKKEHLKFVFNMPENTILDVNCEYHLKVNKSNDKDSTYYQDRIYFGIVNTHGVRKIAIAHSGKHL